jgi:all-trans-8'-apo-beta-carotenal 15,15'-oxygenase
MVRRELTALLLALGTDGANGFVVSQHKPPGLESHRESTSTTRMTAAAETTAAPSIERESMPWPMNTEKHGAFNQDRDWGFAYSSAPSEACSSYIVEDIEGEVPADLAGTFYKAGPGNFEREGRRYEHVLDGDGFIAAFRFKDGKVRYTGRFVETEYFLEEQKEDKIKYRNVFGTQRKGGLLTNAFDLTLKNVANTNVLEWGGRLFALWEAGRPYELNPDTLETLLQTDDGPFEALGSSDCRIRGVTIDQGGPVDQAVSVGRWFTAHPHVLDEDTMVAFKSVVNAKTKDAILEFIEYDKNWQQKSKVEFSFPNGPAPHDFAVSDNYYCFFENPFGEMDNLPYILGLKAPTQIMQLLLHQPTTLNIIPRDSNSGKKALKVEVPPYFNIHSVCKAEEKEGKLYLHTNGWDLKDERFFSASKKTVPFLGSWGGKYPDFEKGIVPPALLYRTVVDLESEEVLSHEEVIPGAVVEFPVQDERDPSNVYFSVASTDYTSLPGSGLCKIDTDDSSVQYWWAENRVFTGEVLPVAKKNGNAGSWLLTLLYDAGNKRTTLGILDSENFEAGPLCRLHLKHHITFGLHGSFSPVKEADKVEFLLDTL